MTGLIAAQAQAVTLPNFASADSKAVLAVCAAERSPLLARQKEYADLRRARLGAAISEGAKAGLTVFATGMLAGLLGGVSTGQPANTANPGEQNGLLAQVMTLKVPGLTSGGNATQTTQSRDDHTQALLALSVVVAIVGSVDAYMRLKQQQYADDTRQMALSIDGDAGVQVPVGAQTEADVRALANCRGQQVDDFRAKLSAASNDKDRKQLLRGQNNLKSALKTDLDMSDEVVGQQVSLTKTFTQGRAMAEGKSEADVLGSQAPAYAPEASHVVLKLAPRTSQGTSPGPQRVEPPKPSYVTTRATIVRSAPNPKASVIMNFPVDRSVTPKGHAVADAAWWEIDVGGVSGFIRGSDLAEPGATPVAPKGKGRGARAKVPAGPPPLEPPNNIRTLNREVLAAKTQGVDRLKTLSTDIQVGYFAPRGRTSRHA